MELVSQLVTVLPHSNKYHEIAPCSRVKKQRGENFNVWCSLSLGRSAWYDRPIYSNIFIVLVTLVATCPQEGSFRTKTKTNDEQKNKETLKLIAVTATDCASVWFVGYLTTLYHMM